MKSEEKFLSWANGSCQWLIACDNTTSIKYMKFKKQFHYLTERSFLVRFSPENSILTKLIKICAADFYKTLRDIAVS